MSDLTDEAANEILQTSEWCKFSDAREMIQEVYAMGHAHAAAVSAAKDARIKVLEDALTKIDVIRNDIIGRQRIGWSSHVYPLVAALDEAGYPGMEYEAARAALGDET